ncbi:MAG: hypothetical protein SF069_12545 [Phycisphaerae bacterium]|nr:hypothetical protein [Phycisphaerae bacterium]
MTGGADGVAEPGPRYVLLEHLTLPRRSRDSASNAAEARHWDLIVYDRPGAVGRTWRLDRNPLDPHERRLPDAQPIVAHRSIYWHYEGELTRDRGVVRRIARGTLREEAPAQSAEQILDAIRRSTPSR